MACARKRDDVMGHVRHSGLPQRLRNIMSNPYKNCYHGLRTIYPKSGRKGGDKFISV